MGRLYYSKRELLGPEYKGNIITSSDFNILSNGYYSIINGVSAGIKADRDEWIKAADSQVVFDNFIVCVDKWSDTFYTNTGENLTSYLPASLCMFDGNYYENEDGCYNVVLIDDKTELRKTTYTRGMLVKERQDNSAEVTDPVIIQKIENTFLAALMVLALREEKRLRRKAGLTELSAKLKPLYTIFGVKSARPILDKYYETEEFDDDILAPLCGKNFLAYIDWKLEYENVCYCLNDLLKKQKVPLIDFDRSKASLTGERAAKYFVSQFYNDDVCFVLIDACTDGLYAGLIQKNELSKLEDELKVFNYKIILSNH